jgi:hypothetical protein
MTPRLLFVCLFNFFHLLLPDHHACECGPEQNDSPQPQRRTCAVFCAQPVRRPCLYVFMWSLGV